MILISSCKIVTKAHVASDFTQWRRGSCDLDESHGALIAGATIISCKYLRSHEPVLVLLCLLARIALAPCSRVHFVFFCYS